jgi:hypothetical protein
MFTWMFSSVLTHLLQMLPEVRVTTSIAKK